FEIERPRETHRTLDPRRVEVQVADACGLGEHDHGFIGARALAASGIAGSSSAGGQGVLLVARGFTAGSRSLRATARACARAASTHRRGWWKASRACDSRRRGSAARSALRPYR